MDAKPIAEHWLTMTPDYVSTWTIWEAVRELLQNSIDQHTANPHSQLIFDYRKKEKADSFLVDLEPPANPPSDLVIGSSNATLPVKTLLLGQTTKGLKKELIGEFGEGYKLALLVLVRLGHDVRIYNGAEIWIPSFEWNDDYGTTLLKVTRYRTADLEDGDQVNGVMFQIGGVTEYEFGTIVERYLPDTPNGAILDADHLRRKVFVGGLFVCEMDELVYGYNLAPGTIKLDRDRGMASSFDVAYETSQCWTASGDVDALYDNMQKGSLDTSYCSYPSTAQANHIAARFAVEHPGAVPVTGDHEAEMYERNGMTVKRVPSAFRDIIRRTIKPVFNRTGTPHERLERFKKDFVRNKLSGDSMHELDAIIEQSKKWRGASGMESKHENDTKVAV